ncbi:hypothetical protein BDY17DRAFT_323379 [Neohortaea acidophila]|uniref:NTF2-like domain-containing protein n=1 Tax=Neohortaea acidophila TaxID=245834 RepID=A0A6A6PXS1_9PEZI|nr:uncharacterized protein BDY17DRAFT_323379 [Neohortaea acidophila]KAF2484534.1 hypothetical protein BDY17DRAFT_323379 [Neohortaea acidophila]
MYSLFFLSLLTAALAAPSLAPRPTSDSSSCMCADDAQQVASNFQALIGQPFSATLAEAALAPTFTDYSDSVIELINAGCPGPLTLGNPTFTSRETFIQGQGKQAPIPFQILNLYNTCSAVILRWRSSAPGFVQPEQQVTGIIILETVANPDAAAAASQPWLIETVYSEFNSGAWLIDVGNFTASCNAPTRRDGAFAGRMHASIRNVGRRTLL